MCWPGNTYQYSHTRFWANTKQYLEHPTITIVVINRNPDTNPIIKTHPTPTPLINPPSLNHPQSRLTHKITVHLPTTPFLHILPHLLTIHRRYIKSFSFSSTRSCIFYILVIIKCIFPWSKWYQWVRVVGYSGQDCVLWGYFSFWVWGLESSVEWAWDWGNEG